MEALFIGHAYIDVTFLADEMPQGDEKSVAKTPNRAKIRRVWPNEPDEPGQLLRVDGCWVFRFNGGPDRFLDAKAKLRSGREVLVSSAGKPSPFTVRIFN